MNNTRIIASAAEGQELIDLITEHEGASIGPVALSGKTHFDGEHTWYQIQFPNGECPCYVARRHETRKPRTRKKLPYRTADGVESISNGNWD